MTEQEIREGAPSGATHYYKNEFVVSYHFYSKEVGLWFVWCKHYNYWSSKCIIERLENLKPL